MEAAIGVVLMLIAITGFIYLLNIFDSRSRRERGLPPRRKRKLRRGKHDKLQ